MKLRTVLIVLVLCPVLNYSQNEKAVAYYNDAVKFYNSENYKTADSLFTLSLNIMPDRDAYFGRAIARGKMAKRQGYCEDLIESSKRGEEKADSLFSNGCGSIKTTFPKLRDTQSPIVILSKLVTYTLPDSSKRFFKQKYYSQQNDSSFRPLPNGLAAKSYSTNAEFPGGVSELMVFIKKNKIFPPNSDGVGKRLVFLKFVVTENGTIEHIAVLKGLADCPECDEEATRLVAIMPRWIPAYVGGRPVKCYFNLPISFRVQ